MDGRQVVDRLNEIANELLYLSIAISILIRDTVGEEEKLLKLLTRMGFLVQQGTEYMSRCKMRIPDELRTRWDNYLAEHKNVRQLIENARSNEKNPKNLSDQLEASVHRLRLEYDELRAEFRAVLQGS